MFDDFTRRDARMEQLCTELRLEEQRADAVVNAKVGDIWFRYDDKTYASSEDEREPARYRTQVEIMRYKVVRVTPKGVQLAGGAYSARRPRFQLHAANKRFACATQELALDSYLARKKRQYSIYHARAELALYCGDQAQSGRGKFVNNPEAIITTRHDW